MDHGNPAIDGATVWFCSDEHVTFSYDEPGPDSHAGLATVGDRVAVWPAHVDPTVAYHERLHIVDGDDGRRSCGRSTCAGGDGYRPGMTDDLAFLDAVAQADLVRRR